jgi:phosphoribosyl-AMP cyclohydrolase
MKGETSGHVQKVRELFIDCDGDALLFKVDQTGAACHENYFTCFFRKNTNGTWQTVLEKTNNL